MVSTHGLFSWEIASSYCYDMIPVRSSCRKIFVANLLCLNILVEAKVEGAGELACSLRACDHDDLVLQQTCAVDGLQVSSDGAL